MYSFHENPTRLPNQEHTIAVFDKDGEPVKADQMNYLLLTLNRLGGLDPDDGLWDDPKTGSELRVAEMLESESEPVDATSPLRKLGGAVIRRLVAHRSSG
jgi:hypothetical protein